jgi:hypothetical protein
MAIKPWYEYRNDGLRSHFPLDKILANWMQYACENFKQARSGVLFFEELFRFARFDEQELRKAKQLCRSSQFVARLQPHRRAFIRGEFYMYEGKQVEEQEVRRYHREMRRHVRQQQRRQQEEDAGQMRQMEDAGPWQVVELDDNSDSLFFDSHQMTSPQQGFQPSHPQQVSQPSRPQQLVSLSQQKLLEVQDEDFDEDFDDVPKHLVCPLSLTIMKEPVMASDGHTYEKNAIQSWMVQKKTSPISRDKLLPHLFPNIQLRNQIDDWKMVYRKARTEAAIKTKAEVDDS